jgi:ketosteroid isomerase-like protein
VITFLDSDAPINASCAEYLAGVLPGARDDCSAISRFSVLIDAGLSRQPEIQGGLQTSRPITQPVPSGILRGGRHPATGNEGCKHSGIPTDRCSATGGEVMEPTTGGSDAGAAEFLEFLERCHDALRQHTGGNPRPYLELWSHADDVSLMGGVGGHQVGIDEVSELLTAAAKTLSYETWSAENLVTGLDDTFGFTVELERLTRHLHGETEEMRLRATSVYRREDGAWKVVHRHGDSLMTVEIDPAGRR